MKISDRRRFLAAACACALLKSASPAFSQAPLPYVSKLFTDNMVLQRAVVDHVWGWTTPGSNVTVSFENKSKSAIADSAGAWNVAIGPFKAGGPYTLTVSGSQTETFSNVMVGDVWLCCGQSNMEFGIGNGQNAAAEIAAANYPNIRIFTVAKTTALTPQPVTTGEWQPVTPDTIQSQGTWNGFSAVAYFYGRALQQSLKIPVGLIQSSWGGTPAEAWTSREALDKSLPEYSDATAAINPVQPETMEQRISEWYLRHDPGVAGNWQTPATDLTAWKPITVPGFFQQAGIPELHAVNGIMWYRTTFDVPAADTGKDAVLHLLVDDNDTTWINGTQIGATEGFSLQRAYAIPAALMKPTGNVIVVRDLDLGGLGGIYGDPSATKVTFTDGSDIPLSGAWEYRLAATLSNVGWYPSVIAGNSSYPTLLFNGMISPIVQFSIKGVLWYQGEANVGNPIRYRTLLPALIADWRSRWNEGPIPFLIVQLAGWQPGGSSWTELRQAQWLTSQNVPNTGIVTAIDIGDQNNIHPKDKQDVGKRLALLAEGTVYGQKLAYSGPVYKSFTVEGSSIRITFTQVNGGLVAQGGMPLTGFEIAGADGNFVGADAKIGKNNTVLVSSPNITSPVAVQYDWSGYPDGNLYNAASLPTFPFKTDEK